MSEYTVVEAPELLEKSETGGYWKILDPLGNSVYQAQYKYMCEDRAYNFNDATKSLRDELTVAQSALEAQSELIAKLLQFRNRLQGTIKWQEKKLDKLERALQSIATNCYQGSMPPLGTDAYLLWKIGETIRKALADSDSKESQENQEE